jgi:hypothetical protein
LKDIKHKDHRIAYTSLRISSHQLAIERGRYSKPFIPRNQRFCFLCENDQVIEDEKHVLLECCAYNDNRQNTFEDIQKVCPLFKTLDSTNTFLYLMTAEGKVSQSVAKFCFLANEIRKTSTNHK